MNAAVLEDVVAAVAEPDTTRVGSKAYDEEASRKHALEHCNRKFAALKADQRIEWALENLPSNHVLTSSFGAQAAVDRDHGAGDVARARAREETDQVRHVLGLPVFADRDLVLGLPLPVFRRVVAQDLVAQDASRRHAAAVAARASERTAP